MSYGECQHGIALHSVPNCVTFALGDSHTWPSLDWAWLEPALSCLWWGAFAAIPKRTASLTLKCSGHWLLLRLLACNYLMKALSVFSGRLGHQHSQRSTSCTLSSFQTPSLVAERAQLSTVSAPSVMAKSVSDQMRLLADNFLHALPMASHCWKFDRYFLLPASWESIRKGVHSRPIETPTENPHKDAHWDAQ